MKNILIRCIEYVVYLATSCAFALGVAYLIEHINEKVFKLED